MRLDVHVHACAVSIDAQLRIPACLSSSNHREQSSVCWTAVHRAVGMRRCDSAQLGLVALAVHEPPDAMCSPDQHLATAWPDPVP